MESRGREATHDMQPPGRLGERELLFWKRMSQRRNIAYAANISSSRFFDGSSSSPSSSSRPPGYWGRGGGWRGADQPYLHLHAIDNCIETTTKKTQKKRNGKLFRPLIGPHMQQMAVSAWPGVFRLHNPSKESFPIKLSSVAQIEANCIMGAMKSHYLLHSALYQ